MGLRWDKGIQQLQVSTPAKVSLRIMASILVLIVGCMLILGLMFLAMPQY